MSDTAITVHGLSKRYNIGARQSGTRTLREAVSATASAPFRRVRSMVRRAKNAADGDNIFWALKGVSFDIKQGEVVGVIGRNGAGKSTLLKILSRITRPTEGYADVVGRVGSLLEVGTGFHGELTGAQNIYLNGAILGMRKAEIKRQFDEIVAFAEIDKFLDTPVKHYSSGMYMRLAFAVAAHLNPEILLVDEVLAVGDAAFQKKCLGKMDTVAKEGRTVLFVSHSMPAVQSLCSRCLFLEAGQVKVFGSLDEGIRRYHQDIEEGQKIPRGEVTLTNLRVNGQTAPHIVSDSPLRFEFDLGIHTSISGYRLFLILEHTLGGTMLHSVVNEREFKQAREQGWYQVSVMAPPLWLNEGVYTVHVKLIGNGVGLQGRYLSERTVVTVASFAYDPESIPGYLAPPVTWRVEPAWEREPSSTESLSVKL
jgi:lipopolysaccharide transport system ATP-binding protein